MAEPIIIAPHMAKGVVAAFMCHQKMSING